MAENGKASRLYAVWLLVLCFELGVWRVGQERVPMSWHLARCLALGPPSEHKLSNPASHGPTTSSIVPYPTLSPNEVSTVSRQNVNVDVNVIVVHVNVNVSAVSVIRRRYSGTNSGRCACACTCPCTCPCTCACACTCTCTCTCLRHSR